MGGDDSEVAAGIHTMLCEFRAVGAVYESVPAPQYQALEHNNG